MSKEIENIETSDDQTIIKCLKDDLLTSEDNFKQLFDSSHVPQWMYDTDSLLLIFVNGAAICKYGYSEEEFLGMTILQIVPPEEAQKIILYNEFMKTTKKPFSVVSPHRKKNNEKVLVESSYFNLRHNNRQCILVTSHDITEKIQFEQKISLLKVARQQKITRATINGQEKERDQVGRKLDDTINQLLAAVMIYLEFARTNEQLRIDYIERGKEILTKAINEIRALSYSLAPPLLKDFGFKDSLEELVEDYLKSQTVNINLVFDEKLNDVDEEIEILLFRIIQEQLNNILKQANAKNIQIRLSSTDQIHLSVIDDGNGFNISIPRKGSGITDMINRVELYDGSIEFISQHQGGCTLLINIPHKVSNKERAYATIFIVEDDPDDQEIIARAFGQMAPHYKITFFNDGKLLIDLLQSFPHNELPALIVLDYNMPLLNGLETLRVLELDNRFNKIPKIIYSSSSQNYIRNLCYSENAKAYITKGTTMDEIMGNIQEMLSFLPAHGPEYLAAPEVNASLTLSRL
jgi:PAS domain S-box-containing protein